MSLRLSATDWSAPLGWFASDTTSEPTPIYEATLADIGLLDRTFASVLRWSDLLQQPDYQTELNPPPEHTYEAHGADVTTTLAVVLDEEVER